VVTVSASQHLQYGTYYPFICAIELSTNDNLDQGWKLIYSIQLINGTCPLRFIQESELSLLSYLLILYALFYDVTGPGRPTAWSEQSQVVVETVTKTSTTQKFAATQQIHESDASKVTATGSGLQTAIANKETTFTVDTTRAGKPRDSSSFCMACSLSSMPGARLIHFTSVSSLVVTHPSTNRGRRALTSSGARDVHSAMNY